MLQENVEVARSFYEAFLAGDDPSSADPFVEPDFEFVPSPRIRILFPAPSHGLDEFNRRLRELANQFESYEAVPERFIDPGDGRVVALLHRTTKRSRGSGRGPDRPLDHHPRRTHQPDRRVRQPRRGPRSGRAAGVGALVAL